MPAMPKDDNDISIPVMFPTAPQKLTSAGTSVRSAVLGSNIIRVVASAAMSYKLGNSSVTATTADHYIPAGLPYDLKTNGNQYIAIIGTGDLYISELV